MELWVRIMVFLRLLYLDKLHDLLIQFQAKNSQETVVLEEKLEKKLKRGEEKERREKPKEKKVTDLNIILNYM